MSKDILICRCEEVMLSELKAGINEGLTTAKALKLKTRAGMGICQGKTCRPLIEQIVAHYTDKEIPDGSDLTFTYPVRPLSLAELAGERKGVE
ncbi:(2Fe-2S)-binding protein [Virgibacillus sp. JSM 102003]|uniref:(2Fe-2S)-binding protein n=1 Tax=Virgibacillus sp. JSM 102003 TaxID=1562108 RepID=UPI0035C10BA5